MPEFIKKYNLDGANLVFQDLSKVKDKRIKFIKENMSVIKDGYIRHNAMIVADTLIKIICDDLKYQDKHNEIEYMLMNSKLQVDKQIKKENERRKKSLKNAKGSNDDKKVQSKFATKYKERIQSIKDSDKEKNVKSKT